MTYTLKVIYDGTIGDGNEIQTLSFSHCPLILFDLSNGVYGQLSGYVSCNVPVIGKTLELDCLLDKFLYNVTNLESNSILEDLSLTPLFDSLYLYPFPFEFVNSDLSFFLRLNLGNLAGRYNLRVYVLETDSTNDLLKLQLDEILNKLNRAELKQNLELAIEVSQNVALGFIGTGLIPVTAGVTTPVPVIVGQPIAGLLTGVF